jgi:hypothetical protein
MRTLAFLGGALLGAISAFGQGQVVVGNYIPLSGVNAPVFDTDCQTRLEGPFFVAQAYVGFTADSLGPVGPVINFRTGEKAGYIMATVVTIPGAWHGRRIYFQLRAWEAQAGASFEAAVVSGGKHGVSNIVPMRAWEPPSPPGDPIGLQSFCLVPEPGAGALLVLGGGLWLLAARRRKQTRGPGPRGGAPCAWSMTATFSSRGSRNCRPVDLDSAGGNYDGIPNWTVTRSAAQGFKLQVGTGGLTYSTHGRIYDPTAVSRDGFARMTAPKNFRLNPVSSLASPSCGGHYYDYSGLAFHGGWLYPVWGDLSNGTGDNPDGTSKPDILVCPLPF